MSTRFVSVRRMAGASLTNLTYLAIQSLLFLLLTPWALRILGDELFGLWTIMLAVIGFAGLANLGANSAVVKYTSQFQGSDDSRMFSAAITFSYVFMFVAGVIASAGLWMVRYWLAARLETDTSSIMLLGNALGLMAIGLTPLLLGQVSKGVLLGLVYNQWAGGLDLMQTAVLWLGVLTLGAQGRGIIHLALWSVVVNALVFVSATVIALRVTRRFQLRFAWDGSLVRDMLRYSLLTWAGSLGIVMFQTLDRVLVGMSLGATAAGIYGIATSVAVRLSTLAGQFTQVLVPLASSYQAEGRRSGIELALRYASRFVACVLTAVASMLVIWMDVILSVWISPQFASDYTVIFRVVVICYGVYAMARPAHQIAQGLGWLKVPTVIFIGSGVSMLLTLWTLAQFLGLTGASIANSVNCLVLSVNLFVARRLGLKPLATVVTDLAPPTLLLIVAAVLAFADLSIVMRLVASFLIALVIFWLALGGNRVQLLVRAIRSS